MIPAPPRISAPAPSFLARRSLRPKSRPAPSPGPRREVLPQPSPRVPRPESLAATRPKANDPDIPHPSATPQEIRPTAWSGAGAKSRRSVKVTQRYDGRARAGS
jgi:hypothetical protein